MMYDRARVAWAGVIAPLLPIVLLPHLAPDCWSRHRVALASAYLIAIGAGTVVQSLLHIAKLPCL